VLQLITVHRVLIGSGITVCLLYAVREIAMSTDTPGPSAFVRAALAVVAAVGLALYLRSIRTL
jgi:hypothetical protein